MRIAHHLAESEAETGAEMVDGRWAVSLLEHKYGGTLTTQMRKREVGDVHPVNSITRTTPLPLPLSVYPYTPLATPPDPAVAPAPAQPAIPAG